MNDSTIAFRAKEQLRKFLGKVFTHFSKPRKKFLADMLYGIQASGDTQLSSVMRAINDDSGKCHAVEKRLSRNVADATIGTEIDIPPFSFSNRQHRRKPQSAKNQHQPQHERQRQDAKRQQFPHMTPYVQL